MPSAMDTLSGETKTFSPAWPREVSRSSPHAKVLLPATTVRSAEVSGRGSSSRGGVGDSAQAARDAAARRAANERRIVNDMGFPDPRDGERLSYLVRPNNASAGQSVTA